MISDWEYQTKTAIVMPFTEGQIVYRDGMLTTLYYETRKTGKMEKVFCGDNPNHDAFIRMFAPDRKVLQILCDVDEKETIHPVGYCWVEMAKGVDGERAAMCGFAFYKFTRNLKALGLLGLAYWMRGLKIDVLHGVMLEDNLVGRKYAGRLGFKQTATVPKFHFYQGKLVSAVSVMLEKKDFDPVYNLWLERQFDMAETT